jgi:HEAT repeat protein
MQASKGPFILFAAGLSAVGLIVFAFAFGLALPRLTAWASRRATRAPAVTPERLRAELAAGLRVSGNVTPESHTEYFGLSYSTYQRWQIDLVLANTTPYALVLGNDLFLVESNADGSGVEGIAYFRGQKSARTLSFNDGSLSALGEWAFEYPFSNYTRVFTDGSRFSRQGGRISLTVTQRSGGRHEREAADFGRLAAGKHTPIRLTLDEGTWLRPETLAGVRVVLPEISLATADGSERLRMTVRCERPSADARRWSVARTELTPLEPLGLARIVESVDTNVVTRVFAAHWLVEREGKKAGPVLARACGTLQQGELLATALGLLSEVKAPELAEHALRLLDDGHVPNGIRHRSAVYLGAVRHAPALDALLRAAKSKDEAVAKGALEGLGGVGGAEAVKALGEVLHARDDERQAVAARALAETGDPAALAALQDLALKGREAAFDALVRAARPESYEGLLTLARGRVQPEWRGRLFLALGRSGGARALPVLVESLGSDPAPGANDALSTDLLVDAILETGPAASRDELVRLARAGNLRALQVLAGWNDAAARAALLEKASSASRTERLIALDGLARTWPNEGREALRVASASADVETAEAGLAGLAQTADPREVGFLLKQLERREERVRQAAASAIERLGPGPHPDEVLAAVLAASDRTCTSSLVDGLIDHEWRDPSSARRIVDRLAARSDDGRFELIRLLRHLSHNALGPEGFAEWKKEPEAWTQRWRDWAAKS